MLQCLVLIVFHEICSLLEYDILMHDCTWGSPLFFLKFSIGILYPIIFIFYLFLLRYLFFTQGNVLYISFSNMMDYFGFFLLFCCYLPVIFVILKKYVYFRDILWINWIDSIYVLNLIFIQNHIYFVIVQNLHQMGNILQSLFYNSKFYKNIFIKLIYV